MSDNIEVVKHRRRGIKTCHPLGGRALWTRQSVGWECDGTYEGLDLKKHFYTDECKCAACEVLRLEWTKEEYIKELEATPIPQAHAALPLSDIPKHLPSAEGLIIDETELSRMHRSAIVQKGVKRALEMERTRLPEIIRRPFDLIAPRIEAAKSKFEPTNPYHLEMVVDFLIIKPIESGEELKKDIATKSNQLRRVIMKAQDMYVSTRQKMAGTDVPETLMMMFEASAREARDIYVNASSLLCANEQQHEVMKEALAPIYVLRDDMKDYCATAKDMSELRKMAAEVNAIQAASEKNATMVTLLATYCHNAVGMMGDVRKALECVDKATVEMRSISASVGETHTSLVK